MFSGHHPQEQDYWYEEVEVTTPNGNVSTQETFLLRVYPEPFNTYDAYMDIPKTNEIPNFQKVHSPRLGITWEVIAGPSESPIDGNFRGDETHNNPRAWMFVLKKLEPEKTA